MNWGEASLKKKKRGRKEFQKEVNSRSEPEMGPSQRWGGEKGHTRSNLSPTLPPGTGGEKNCKAATRLLKESVQ